uniref:Transposase n=1 Tax=Panagrellus redivivus TaxID=6233 RepID=A0A7E4UWZ4_PANRE
MGTKIVNHVITLGLTTDCIHLKQLYEQKNNKAAQSKKITFSINVRTMASKREVFATASNLRRKSESTVAEVRTLAKHAKTSGVTCRFGDKNLCASTSCV